MISEKLLGILSLISVIIAGLGILASSGEAHTEIYFFGGLFFLALFFILGIFHCGVAYTSNKKFIKFFVTYSIIFLIWYLITREGCNFWNGCLLSREMIMFAAISSSGLLLIVKILTNLLSRKLNNVSGRLVVNELPKENQKVIFLKILAILIAIIWFFSAGL